MSRLPFTFDELGLHDKPHLAESLVASGFNPREPEDVILGVQLYGVSARMTASSRPGGPEPEPARSGKRVGRNAPCPCGSGKKYKRCCLRDDKAFAEGSSSATVEEPPWALPRLDDDSFGVHLVRATTLIFSEPRLHDKVPDLEAVDEFLAVHTEACSDDLDEEQLDAVGTAFTSETMDAAGYRALFDALIVCGGEYPGDHDDRCALVLAGYLVEAARLGTDEDLTLGISLFRRLRAHLFQLVELVAGTERGLRDGRLSAAVAVGAKRREEAAEESSFDPTDPALLEELEGGAILETLARVERGNFEVPLPLASALPAWAAIGRDLPPDEARAEFDAAIDRLGDEDRKLLGEALAGCLEDDRLGPLARARVGLVAALVDEGRREILRALAIGSLRNRECAEGLYLDDSCFGDADDYRESRALESYALDLADRGYIALSERTLRYARQR